MLFAVLTVGLIWLDVKPKFDKMVSVMKPKLDGVTGKIWLGDRFQPRRKILDSAINAFKLYNLAYFRRITRHSHKYAANIF